MFYNNSVIVSTTFSLTNEYILLVMGLILERPLAVDSLKHYTTWGVSAIPKNTRYKMLL